MFKPQLMIKLIWVYKYTRPLQQRLKTLSWQWPASRGHCNFMTLWQQSWAETHQWVTVVRVCDKDNKSEVRKSNEWFWGKVLTDWRERGRQEEALKTETEQTMKYGTELCPLSWSCPWNDWTFYITKKSNINKTILK